jgi:hypothetical protein
VSAPLTRSPPNDRRQKITPISAHANSRNNHAYRSRGDTLTLTLSPTSKHYRRDRSTIADTVPPRSYNCAATFKQGHLHPFPRFGERVIKKQRTGNVRPLFQHAQRVYKASTPGHKFSCSPSSDQEGPPTAALCT